uniref:Uncharacterized protein n=1 Tax=Mus musculus TaxID=10090 RepID=Q9CZI4_MOUSE|nr:unnamed protein product [Mus musculus]
MQACVMPSLLQNMVGFSEVARATQTDPRPQRPAPPQPQAATMPWSQPGSWARRGFVPAWSQPPALSQQKLARRCCLGLGQDSSRTSSLCPGTLHRPALSPPQRGCGLQPLLSVGLWGTEPYTSSCGRPFSALGCLHFRKSRTLYPNCLLPALPTLCRGGASASQARRADGLLPSCPSPWGVLGHSSGSTTQPPTCPVGLVSLEAPSRVAGPIQSSASLILFMLVFTIWSGVPGQAAPPGVGRAVLFEPVRLDSTVPRPTEDTVM